MANIPKIYQQLAKEVIKQEGHIEMSAKDFVDKFVAKLRDQGRKITPAVQDEMTAYLASMHILMNTSIVSAATIAAGTVDKKMQSAFISKLTEQAYNQRWPDGLNLSKRLWKWDNSVKDGLSKTLQQAVKQGQSVNKIVYDMQRSIERAPGGRLFQIVEHHKDDWVKELHEAATGLIHNPEMKKYWDEAVAEAEYRITTLSKTGSRTAAEQVVKQIKLAVQNGSEELADKAVKWWMYDKQLYHLKRIARTEMATTLHQAVIASTKDDETVIGYQWRLSSSHPVSDVCDYYANIEIGLGKGVFTKETVPNMKAHPHCMCIIQPRVTAIKKRGSNSYDDFLKRFPDAKNG